MNVSNCISTRYIYVYVSNDIQYIIYHIFSKTIFAEREAGRENRILINDREARCVYRLCFWIYQNIIIIEYLLRKYWWHICALASADYKK